MIALGTAIFGVLARDSMYQPEVGSTLTVSLPGEYVRATVARVADRDTVLVELHHVLNVARQHMYRVGDIVCVRRTITPLNETWEAVDERRLPVIEPPAKKPPPRAKVKQKRGRVVMKKRAVTAAKKKKAKRRAVDRT